METFKITFILVSIMLCFAIPGYLLIQLKMMKPEHIASFSKLLMFICQPALTLYAFNKADYTKQLGQKLLLFFGIITCAQILFLAIFYCLFRKKMDDVNYRIATIATTLTNCSFFGVPLLEAIFPSANDVAVYSMMYFLSMSLIGWSIVSAIVNKDKKYMNIKKFLFNPATISIAIALPFFLLKFKISAENGLFFAQLDSMITILGKMTTPLCMLIMGMRLATISWKKLFVNPMQYLIIAMNQIVFPLFIFFFTYYLPLENEFKICLFVMAACPVASVVQNYAEIYQKGQESAANFVLLGTILSIITLPIMTFLGSR